MVSVVIPAYNAEDYIRETLDSVLTQSYQNIEIIIVNDGSTDSTELILQEFAKAYKQIKYFNQSNSGVSEARNHAISKATGSYIALLDADDVWYQNNLEEKINIFENYSEIDWVFSGMDFLLDGDRTGKAPRGIQGEFLDLILLWESEVVPGPCSNIVFRRKCYDEGIFFDRRFSTAADQDFTIQLAARYKGYYINKPLWKYRVLEQSMSRNISIMEKDHIGVYQKAKRLGLFRSFWFKQRCFSNLYLILAGSWWKNGNDKLKGLYFILKALLYYPLNIKKLIVKFF